MLKGRTDSARQRPKPLAFVRGQSPNGGKREQAYQQLRRLLILQQIPAGSRLTESAWTARTGANRTALREAFARLEAEGLIRFGPKTGYVVPHVSLEDVREVLDVRIALEGMAIELICGAGLNTPAHLKRSLDACALMEQLADDDYHVTTVEADRRFHESLIEAVGNRRLVIVYRHAPLPIFHPEITWGPRWVDRVGQSIREHRSVLDAMFQGQASQARDLLRAHLTGPWGGRAEVSTGSAGGMSGSSLQKGEVHPGDRDGS